MELLARLWNVSWSHVTSHVSYFSGVSMLLPTLTQSMVRGEYPWLAYPKLFIFAVLLMIVGVAILFWLEKSVGKLFRTIGWMMLIPGMIALLFSAIGSDLFYGSIQNMITGFAVVEPTVHWIVDHSIPQTVNVAAGYVFFGICFVWIGNKIGGVAQYL